MKKLWMAAITAVLMFFGGIAQATPIINNDFQFAQGDNQLQGEGVVESTSIINNWQFTWGSDQFADGVGWIWDMDGVVAPLQVKFTKTSLTDPLAAIPNWISPLSSFEGSYTFSSIHLESILDGVYYTSLGKGEWFSGGANPFNDGVTFSGVGLELTQVSAVPEPSPFVLLTAGLIAIGFARNKRQYSSQGGREFFGIVRKKIRTRAVYARVLKLFIVT